MKIFALIILVLLLTGCSTNLGFVENKVYNENALKNYSNLSDDILMDKYITRQDAIKIAYNVISKGFGVQIDRNSLDEYISLDESNSRFFWNISILKEYELLLVFLHNKNIALSRDQLLEKV